MTTTIPTALFILSMLATSSMAMTTNSVVIAETPASTLSKQTPSVTENEYLYEIKDNEIMVNDKLITLFAFSKNGISVSYRNKTDKKKKPKYTFKVYNTYGMLIGSKELGGSSLSFGNSTYMEPGEISSEKIHLKPFPLDEILKYASIEIPSDLLDMKWVVISDSNTKE